MLDEIINEIQMPADIASLTADIALPEMPDVSLDNDTNDKDIFGSKARKAWDKSEEARCDFQYHLRLLVQYQNQLQYHEHKLDQQSFLLNEQPYLHLNDS